MASIDTALPASRKAASCADPIAGRSATTEGAVVDGDTLTLKAVSPRTIAFTERPDRKVVPLDTTDFITNVWKAGTDSLAANPPNAVIVYSGEGKITNAVVELTSVSVNGSDVVYSLRALDSQLPPELDTVDLVIDATPGDYMFDGNVFHKLH